MSEEETKITSSEQPRVKDPKRVAAGKRLGAISKAAKEKKARERYNREKELEGTNWMIPAGIGGGVVTVAGLCYVYCKREPKIEPPSPEPSTQRRRTAPVFDSLGE